MGRVITLSAFLILLSSFAAATSIPQQHKDLIREYYIERIMNVKPDFINLSRDIRVSRYIFRNSDSEDVREYPLLHDIPLVRIFNREDLTLENIVKLAGLSTNFDVLIHPDVDSGQLIALNSQFNSWESLAFYLDRVSSATVGMANESRMIIVMPGPMHGYDESK